MNSLKTFKTSDESILPFLVTPLGLEPRLENLEVSVLPLHHEVLFHEQSYKK